MSIRTEKVSSVIKRSLAAPINVIANENKAGLVTVTNVIVSPDLQYAKVYLSIFGGKITPLGFIAILENNIGHIKNEISDELKLRYMPNFKFYLDDTLDKINEIQGVINQIGPDKENKPINFDNVKY